MARKKHARSEEAKQAQPPAVEAPRRPILELVIPLVLVLATLVLGLNYVSQPGYVWDESYYFAFATGVRNWIAEPTLAEETVNHVFREGNAHPPLPLYVMALTQSIFWTDVGDFLLSVRIATILQFAALVLIVYLFVRREAGLAAGAFAGALTLLSPRLFGHALLATYEIPLVLFWTATTFAFYLGMRSRAWAVLSGVLFGLALLTKVNAFILPAALWPAGLVFYRKKSLPAIIAMAAIGPVILFAGWPWLWLHPVSNFVEYIADKLPAGVLPQSLTAGTAAAGIAWREAIPTLYFGQAAPGGPPWHYPFVMTILTMPLATLAGAVLSILRARREPEARPVTVLLWWGVVVQLLVFGFAMRAYDGVRLFAPVLALASAAGGLGLAWLAARGRRMLAVAAALVILSPGVEFFVYAPYGLSYYTPVVGGLPGAQALGMEVTYYGEAVSAGELAAINARAQAGDRVAYAPMFKRLPWRMPVEYIRYTFLSADLKPAAPTEDWDFLIFVNRGGQIDAVDRENLEKGSAIAENRLLGVVLSQALERRAEAPVEE